jgi:hypothetical protein
MVELNQEVRQTSQQKLLNHLATRGDELFTLEAVPEIEIPLDTIIRRGKNGVEYNHGFVQGEMKNPLKVKIRAIGEKSIRDKKHIAKYKIQPVEIETKDGRLIEINQIELVYKIDNFGIPSKWKDGQKERQIRTELTNFIKESEEKIYADGRNIGDDQVIEIGDEVILTLETGANNKATEKNSEGAEYEV